MVLLKWESFWIKYVVLFIFFIRYIFWTDWYRPAKIMRAWGDGSHALSIVNTTLGWPNGLAIDWRWTIYHYSFLPINCCSYGPLLASMWLLIVNWYFFALLSSQFYASVLGGCLLWQNRAQQLWWTEQTFFGPHIPDLPSIWSHHFWRLGISFKLPCYLVQYHTFDLNDEWVLITKNCHVLLWWWSC